jgi:hypothetical protein
LVGWFFVADHTLLIQPHNVRHPTNRPERYYREPALKFGKHLDGVAGAAETGGLVTLLKLPLIKFLEER